MRLAQVGLGSGVGLTELSFIDYDPGQVRVQVFLRQKRQTTTATYDPPESLYECR